MINTSNLFIKLSLLALASILVSSCAPDTNELSNGKKTWNISDGVEFPNNRPLSRSEDGVMLPDGTLIVADQRYGLAKIDMTGSCLLYTSPSPRDGLLSRMPSSA